MQSLSFNENGSKIAIGTTRGGVFIFDVGSQKIEEVLLESDVQIRVRAVAFSPDGMWLLVAKSRFVHVFNAQTYQLSHCLFNQYTISTTEKITQYESINSDNFIINYSIPCNGNVPENAVCTCNCVAGIFTERTPPTRPTTTTTCTCNSVCTCVPVCQAHRVLDDDPIVVLMAEEILYLMGEKETPYMKWAANEASTGLRQRIYEIIDNISVGVTADPDRWPSVSLLSQYMDADDDVVSLMSAQLVNQMSSCPHHFVPLEVKDKSCLIINATRRRMDEVREEVALFEFGLTN